MGIYRDIFGPPEKHRSGADGSGGTPTPMPTPSVEPDVPDGYVPEERVEAMRQQLEQKEASVGPAAGVEASRRSSFDRLADRLSEWLR